MVMKDRNASVLECPGCLNTEWRLFLVSNGRDILRCVACGLLAVHPRPSLEEIRRLFEEDYIRDESRVEQDFTTFRAASLAREAALLRSLRPRGGTLLDLGTASGAFLGEFAGFPEWRVEGVEPSRYAAQAASARYGVPVHQGFLAQQQFPDAAFDVVTSLDGFYFHPEPAADLRELARIIKPGGVLAIEIPGLRFRLLKNSGWICRLLYGISARLNAGVHLFYYSRVTLGRMAARFGFQELSAHPEQAPVYGSAGMRFLNRLYYGFSATVYRVSGGVLNLAPKEFILYQRRDP